MDIKTLHEKYKNGELTVASYIEKIYENIENNKYNSYITLNKEEALNQAKELDEKIKNGSEIDGLFGVPVAVKDNILTDGLRTTAASESLSNFVPFFDADIIEKLKQTDAIIIGKANMDEYAMGSSSETSYFGASINPFDPSLSPGGSSSGTATAIAAEEAVVGFGTDTGGSVRTPADFCNIVGFAPTYGAISRYGVISMSNSFDRVGIMANNVEDIRVLFDVSRGKSDMDFTSHNLQEFDEDINLSDIKIATIKLKDEYNVNPEIRSLFSESLEKIKSTGAVIEEVELEHLEALNQVYTVIMSVEVESNIAKIDGLRYGESVEEYNSTEDFYISNRSEHFGEEVKRRIALGNYFSSKDTDQKYYKKAMEIRHQVRSQINELLDKYDVILTPTTIDLPRKVGETSEDSFASFDTGMFNTITNLSDIPAISLPISKERLGSIQIAGNRNEDIKLLKIAEEIERSL